MLVIESPSKLRIPSSVQRERLERLLTYSDNRAAQDLTRFRQSWRGKTLKSEDPEQYQTELNIFKAKVDCSALFEDEKGYWTYSGLAPLLRDQLGLRIEQTYPISRPWAMSWIKTPPPPRYYQMRSSPNDPPGAVDIMLENPHCCIELPTGSGKSWIIRQLCREVGGKTTVMVPYKQVAQQLHRDLSDHLGAPWVGQFFDGKKDSGRKITVATPQSLLRVEPGSEHWDNLSKTEVFIPDESHMIPVETVAKVCMGVMGNAQRRWFLSGTQMRTDGRQLVLDGLTGPCVMRIQPREGIERGWLARPEFIMLNVRSSSDYSSSDVVREIRAHLYKNPQVTSILGRTVSAVANQGDKVLVLIDEVGQVSHLLPHLRCGVKLAHGDSQKKDSELPLEMRRSNPLALVEEFNAGKIPALLGTGCVGTGVDFRPPGPMSMFWLVGGQSEIAFRQGVGRALRIEGKSEVKIFIPDVVNVPSLHRHAEKLREICTDIWTIPREIVLT